MKKNNYMIVKALIMPLLFILLSTTFVNAQITVTGVVTDETGPIPGANVFVKGTTDGVQTDVDGKYSLSDLQETSVLVYSFIGLETKEIVVGNQTTIDVVLGASTSVLSEVVVTGYGNVSKKDATGAVDAIGAEKFDMIAAPSPAQILRGKVAGVQVTQSSGEPGAGMAIRIRGNTSIRSGNQPLIVVDGVPLDGGNISSGVDADNNIAGKGSARNPLNFINQNDIQSINILKDASSTAIYGSRGANGVVVITTKKGSKGAYGTQISYSPSVTVSSFAQNSSYEDVMSSAEYKSARGTGFTEDGNYNWQDVLLRTGITHNHDLTLVSTSENSSTRLSFGASQQQGIIKKTGLDKYTLSFTNSNGFFDKRLNVSTRMLYTKLVDKSHLLTTNAGFIGNIIGAALYWRPSLSVYGGAGSDTNSGYTFVSNNYLNPQQLLDAYSDNTVTDKILANITSTFDITDNLTYKFLIGIDNSTSERGLQLLPMLKLQDNAQVTVGSTTFYGAASLYNDRRFNTTLEHTLNYKKVLDNGVSLDILGGYSYYSYQSEGNFANAEGFNADQVRLIENIEGATQSGGYILTSYKSESEIQSFYARALVNYEDFLATVTLRADGSSKLGNNNKYGYFPSVGLGYKIFENGDGLVNDLKFRVNWGIVGNQEFSSNSAIAKVSYNNTALRTDTNSNPDLKWETTTSYGAGFDFELINNKLSGSIDYFQKSTVDLIFAVPPASTQPGPATSRFTNLDGTLQNSGLEIGLNYILLNKQDIVWSVNANAAFLSNKMQDFVPFVQTGELNGQGLTNAYAQVLSNDKPLYSYFLYEFRGYDANGVSQYTQADGSAGSLGTALKDYVDKEALPSVNIGFSTTVEYKDFDLSTSFYGSYGHYIYNNTANALYYTGTLATRNITSSVNSSGQNASDPNTPSTKYLEKGDFLRWSNLSIGYKLPNTILEKIGAKNTRIYFNMSNILIFTNYSGFDPEVDTDKTLNGVPSAGMDYLSYPRERSYTIGLNVTF